MPSCDYYFGKLFAHLAAALAVSAVSAQSSDIGATMYGNASPLIKLLGNMAILVGTSYGMYATKPGGIPKYALFLIFAFWVGQVMKPYVVRLQDKGTLTRVLMLTTGVFVGMMALGFYDSMNLLGFGPYLAAGLIGLILAQLLLLAFGTPEEKQKGFKWLNIFGVALFAVFTAFDVQVVRAGAKYCRTAQKKLRVDPDYPVESLGLYLDFINLFGRLGDD